MRNRRTYVALASTRMSNKRNRRRSRQRVRSEIRRKPVKITKASFALIAAQPAERERKKIEQRRTKPSKAERRRIELIHRRWLLQGPRKKRKPRTNYGKTFWKHSHDV